MVGRVQPKDGAGWFISWVMVRREGVRQEKGRRWRRKEGLLTIGGVTNI